MPASSTPRHSAEQPNDDQFSADHEDGLPRRWKLLLIELADLALLVFGVIRIGVDTDWARGVPVLVLGAFVLLNPAQTVRFIERFLPSG